MVQYIIKIFYYISNIFSMKKNITNKKNNTSNITNKASNDEYIDYIFNNNITVIKLGDSLYPITYKQTEYM